MYSISEFATLLGLHIQTLRTYDNEGILCPSRTPGNQRVYSEGNLVLGNFIVFLTSDLGLNLNGVKIILEFLKKNKIRPELYKEFIEGMAKNAGIL